MDADGVAEFHCAGNVVTTIYIINITICNEHTGCVAGRESVTLITYGEGFLLDSGGCRTDIGSSASAIDIVNSDIFGRQCQDEPVLIRHIAGISAAVEVADGATLEEPFRADCHFGVVVAAEDTGELLVAFQIGL